MPESNITAGMVAEEVASAIGMCWPQDGERIFKNLSHVQDEIWETGKFYGSTAFFYCKVTPSKQLITPNGYSILLGLDLNTKPIDLRGADFLFNKNGPGDLLHYTNKNKLYREAYALGSSPVRLQPTDEKDKTPKFIIVKSDCGNSDPPYKFAQISGNNCHGNRIYSYRAVDKDGKDETCVCGSLRTDNENITVVDGIKYPISSIPFVPKDQRLAFTWISNIIKEPTESPVEFWMADQSGASIMIARMEPWEVVSRYQIYQLPKDCQKLHSVLGLFKRTKPERIISEEQIFISSNLSAIKSMAIAVDYQYEKKDLGKAEPYFAAAASHLNADSREHNANTKNTLQVSHTSGWGKFPRM